jgi:hypothetical protein
MNYSYSSRLSGGMSGGRARGKGQGAKIEVKDKI